MGEFETLLKIYRKATSQQDNKFHQHIMEALAGYDYGDIFFIIFSYAESTLAKCLQGKEIPGNQDLWGPSYFWRQMRGVAGGLSFLHERRTTNTTNSDFPPTQVFHFDLKPHNILIRNGIVVMGDFGQSKIQKYSEDVGADINHLSYNYGPPEHHFISSYGQQHDYNFDIWSLGAIFSEIITFHAEGSKGVERYRKSRQEDGIHAGNVSAITFFVDEDTVKIVKPSVVEQHDKLSTENRNRDGLTYNESKDPWLDHLTTNGLFALINKMLSILTENNQRPTAEMVQIYQSICVELSYLLV